MNKTPQKVFSSLLIIVFALALAPYTLAVAAPSANELGVCGDPFTPIYEIQGNGAESDFHGDVVVTEGIVTVDLQKSSELSGFFIQDGTGDGDPATSDGLFVNHRDTWSPALDPSVGDLVRVKGTIDEQFGLTQMEYLEACHAIVRAEIHTAITTFLVKIHPGHRQSVRVTVVLLRSKDP